MVNRWYTLSYRGNKSRLWLGGKYCTLGKTVRYKVLYDISTYKIGQLPIKKALIFPWWHCFRRQYNKKYNFFFCSTGNDRHQNWSLRLRKTFRLLFPSWNTQLFFFKGLSGEHFSNRELVFLRCVRHSQGGQRDCACLKVV